MKQPVTLFLTLLVLPVGNYVAADGSALPNDIARHYESYNFVSSFSTAKERAAILASSRLPDRSAARPYESARLRAIRQHIEIIRNDYTPWRSDGVIPRRDSVLVLNQLLDIEGVKITARSMVLRVKAYGLASGQNQRLISAYEYADEQAQPVPSFEQRLGEGSRFHYELHRWRKIDGRWRLDNGHIILTTW